MFNNNFNNKISGIVNKDDPLLKNINKGLNEEFNEINEIIDVKNPNDDTINNIINKNSNNIDTILPQYNDLFFNSTLRGYGSGGYTAPDYSRHFGKNTHISNNPNNKEAKYAQQHFNRTTVAAGPPSLMTPNIVLTDNDVADTTYAPSYTITCLAGRGINIFMEDGKKIYEIGVDNDLYRDKYGKKSWYDVTPDDDNINAKEPTTSNIIRWSNSTNAKYIMPYKYTDFIFLKYWNKIPNNYLITLRRFATPVWDNLEFFMESSGSSTSQSYSKQINTPIAQALTYIGEEPGNQLSSILSFSCGLKWRELTAQLHEITERPPGMTEGTKGLLVPFGGKAGQVAGDAVFRTSQILGLLTGETDFNALKWGDQPPPNPYENGPYMYHLKGPMNSINSIMTRDIGLSFDHSISLNFHYVAKSIDGINTKAVMLDILANLLLLTYADAGFWGGNYRFLGGKPMYPFLGGKSGLQKYYKGDFFGFVDSVINQFKDASKSLVKIFESLFSGNLSLEQIASLGLGKGAELGMGALLGKNAIRLPLLPALLSGAPTGEWHLVIGNPMNPIAVIGNLICEGLKIEFGDTLGPDDFPTELKATITLKHAMPRDKAAIEAMFNKGEGKIYTLPDELQYYTSYLKDIEKKYKMSTAHAFATIASPGANDEIEKTQRRKTLEELAEEYQFKFRRTIKLGQKTYGDILAESHKNKSINLPTLRSYLNALGYNDATKLLGE